MLGTTALALLALLYASMLVALRRADATLGGGSSSAAWWFGYARDAVSMFGFLSFSGAFALSGLPGPLAFLAGASLTLLGYGLDHLLAATLPPGRAAAFLRILLVVIAAASGALRDPLARGLRAVVREMF